MASKVKEQEKEEMKIAARISNLSELDYKGFTPIATYIVDKDTGREIHVLCKERLLKVFDAQTHEFVVQEELTDNLISVYFLGVPPYHLFS